MMALQSRKTKNQKKLPDDNGRKGIQDFGKYSGLAFQMIVIIGGMTWIGVKLDKFFSLETPVCTIIFSLLGVFGGIYISLKDFIK